MMTWKMRSALLKFLKYFQDWPKVPRDVAVTVNEGGLMRRKKELRKQQFLLSGKMRF
ncbi:hypothetical protein AAKU55_000088 [Oxalobacteraceae bacterium GrIS 1.11]